MEILFKNHYTKTEAWIKECNLISFWRRPILIVFHLLALILLAAGIYKLVFWHRINILYLFTPIWWFLVITMTYFRLNRITIKRSLELNEKNSQVFSEVTDGSIKRVSSNGAEYTITYDVIKRGYISPNYILLQSKAGILYTFRRAGFLIGNEEEFLRFLKSKGIKVK